MSCRLRTSAAAVLVVSLMVPLTPAAAESDQEGQEKPEELDEVTQAMVNESITEFSPVITEFNADEGVQDLGDADAEDDEVIVLEADILFEPNSWEPPDNAGEQIEELVEEVPEGSEVEVTGHTDSRPVSDDYDFDNDELSENRAQAVADELEDERPDLDLTVEGRGDSDPAETEDEEDPSTFAANRRVEIDFDQ